MVNYNYSSMGVQKMFVLADIEWNTNEQRVKSPTQLAAVKVDEQWNIVDRFNSLIRPRDESFYDWKHISYKGANADSFLNARNAYGVLSDFLRWLDEDDILLWWREKSAKLFRRLVGNIFKQTDEHRYVVVCDYVYEFLRGQPFSHGSAYEIAEGRGIDTLSRLENCAVNDVRVMQELLRYIAYPQELMLKPFVPSEKAPSVQVRANADQRYQYDPSANMIHILECDKYDHSDMTVKGYPNFKTARKMNYLICECCKNDYQAELREKNRKIVDNSQYTYIYTPTSNVFHRWDCELILDAKTIMGTRHYSTVIKTGRIPCKTCEPTATDRHRQLSPYARQMQLLNEVTQSSTGEMSKALHRQWVAAKDREELLNDPSLSQQEISDIYTLTQPRFVFWAAKGYSFFHHRGCPKLRGVSELKGFSTFRDATRAGFRPCRQCKPSANQDIHLSIPITSTQRNNDTIEEIEPLCRDAGYAFSYESQYFCLETPVGKWRINTSTSPIKLQHINLVKSLNEVKYHNQPRLFLSFVDAFHYIKRHDEELMRKESQL